MDRGYGWSEDRVAVAAQPVVGEFSCNLALNGRWNFWTPLLSMGA